MVSEVRCALERFPLEVNKNKIGMTLFSLIIKNFKIIIITNRVVVVGFWAIQSNSINCMFVLSSNL